MVDRNITEVKRILEKLHGVVSRDETPSKVGMICYLKEGDTFLYEHLIQEGRWLDREVGVLEALPHSKRRCFLEEREVIDHTSKDYSVLNYPLKSNGGVWGILTIQIEKADYFSQKKIESYRVLFEAVHLYFKGEEKKVALLREKEELIDVAHTLDLVTEISQVIVSTSSIKEMSKKLYLEMKRNFGECSIGIATNSRKERRLEDCFYHEFDTCFDFGDIFYSDLGGSKLLEAVLNQKEYIYEGLRKSTLKTVVGEAPTASYFTPLKMKGEVIGAFTYQIFKKSNFSRKEIDICRRLIPFVTIALNNTLQARQLSKANKLLQYYSTTDDLTKVFTRRFFYEVFEKRYLEARKVKKNSFLLLVDIDNFKGVNDNFGHSLGDEVLQKVSDILTDTLSLGIVGRYGGDEFLGGITGLVMEEVCEIAAGIVDKVEKLRIPYNKEGNTIGVSIGILELSGGRPLREYFPQLDKNLYRAKKDKVGIVSSKSFH